MQSKPADSYRSDRRNFPLLSDTTTASGVPPTPPLSLKASGVRGKNFTRKPPELRPRTVSSRSKDTVTASGPSLKTSRKPGMSTATSRGVFDVAQCLSFIKGGEDGMFVILVKKFGIETALALAKRDRMGCGPLIRRPRRAGILPQSPERWKRITRRAEAFLLASTRDR